MGAFGAVPDSSTETPTFRIAHVSISAIHRRASVPDQQAPATFVVYCSAVTLDFDVLPLPVSPAKSIVIPPQHQYAVFVTT